MARNKLTTTAVASVMFAGVLAGCSESKGQEATPETSRTAAPSPAVSEACGALAFPNFGAGNPNADGLFPAVNAGGCAEVYSASETSIIIGTIAAGETFYVTCITEGAAGLQIKQDPNKADGHDEGVVMLDDVAKMQHTDTPAGLEYCQGAAPAPVAPGE